jgi:hypothetical protein
MRQVYLDSHRTWVHENVYQAKSGYLEQTFFYLSLYNPIWILEHTRLAPKTPGPYKSINPILMFNFLLLFSSLVGSTFLLDFFFSPA